MYEIFEHTADVGIRARAGDLNLLFCEAARGLFAVIVNNPQEIRLVERVEYAISGSQKDFLLVDWLGELLFTFESRGLLFSEFSVQLNDGGLTATAAGETFDDQRHRLEHEVKAITYHGLRVARTEGGWLAEVILDI